MADFSLGQLFASLGLRDQEFRAGMANARVQMQATSAASVKMTATVNASLMKVSRQLKTVGSAFTTYLTLPLLAIGGAAFKVGADFESSLSKIEGLVGVAREQVQAWRQDILDMAPAVGKGPGELADALFFITSAGIKGAEAMDVLNISARASRAGLGETKVVADLVTSAMNAYGKENLSAAMAADILTATVREGKAEAVDLANSMGQVLPIASAMGVKFDEVGAAQAAMTRTGTNAATAAVQLKAILTALLNVKPGDAASVALGQMGTSAAELRKTIKEDGLLKALMDVRGMINTFGEEVAGQVFPNVRALSGVLDLLGSNAEENIAIFNSLSDSTGALNHAVEAVKKDMNILWKDTLAQLKVTLVEFSDVIKQIALPMLTKLGKWFKKAAEWLRGLTDEQQKALAKTIAFAVAFGPVVKILGVLAGGLLPRLVSLIGFLGKAFLSLAAFNPFIAIATAIGIAVGAFALFLKKQNQASEAFISMQQVNQQVTQQYAEQAGEIKNLTWQIENENLSNGKRIKAIEALKKLMPTYNGQLTEEGELIGHNTTQIGTYLEALKEKIKLQVYEKNYTEAITKQIKLQDELTAATDAHVMALAKRDALPKNTGQWNQKPYAEVQKEIREAFNLKETLKIALADADSFVTAMETKMEGLDIGGTTPVKEKKKSGGSGGGDPILQLGLIAKLEKKIQEETANGLALTTEAEIYRHQERLANLNAELDRVNTLYQTEQDLIKKTAEDLQTKLWAGLEGDGFEVFNDGMEELSQNYMNAVALMQGANQILKDSIIDTFESIGDAIGSGTGLQGILSSVLSSLGSMMISFGKLILATGVAVEAFTKSIQSLNGFAAIAAGAALVIAGAAVRNFAGAHGMADGGVIPGGYPNDTYPAFLSSGETVTPPGKLKSSGNDYSGPIEFEIKGDVLVGMINKMNRKNNIR